MRNELMNICYYSNFRNYFYFILIHLYCQVIRKLRLQTFIQEFITEEPREDLCMLSVAVCSQSPYAIGSGGRVLTLKIVFDFSRKIL